MKASRQTADFFSHQEQARKLGRWYLMVFGLVVFVTVALCYLLGAGLMIALSPETARAVWGSPPSVWRLQPFVTITFMLFLIVVLISWSKIKTLQNEDGIYELARLLEGKFLERGQASPEEQRVINIIEEMSVAAGLPCPDILILPHQLGINALAAGFDPQQALVGLTQGAIDRLDRDELQAVAAHEFGHILSGDMRVNMKLAGWLYGLLALSIGGGFLMRSRHVLLMWLGAAVWITGKAGHLGAQITQAALNRQREYLADSRGAQFTRNPEALARALMKIGGLAEGGRISSPAALMFQHMFIASPVESLFASHPDLDSRIARLSPSWDGKYLAAPLSPKAQRREAERAVRRREAAQAKEKVRASLKARKYKLNVLLNNEAMTSLTDLVGVVLPENLALAEALLESWPVSLRRAAENPLKATAVATVAFLDARNLDKRLKVIRPLFGAAWTNQILLWRRELEKNGPNSWLPLLDVALPALKKLKKEDAERLLALARSLIQVGGCPSLFEFAALKILNQNLAGGLRPSGEPITLLRQVRTECETLLNFLAWQGHPGYREEAAKAFQAGQLAFKSTAFSSIKLGEESGCQVEALASALNALSRATPQIKKTVLSAALLCIDHDQKVNQAEYETLRALGAALDCPLPLLAPTANSAPGPETVPAGSVAGR